MDSRPWLPDPPTDAADRAELLELHRRAYCLCTWCDHVEEARYHLAEIERLERQP